MKKSTFIFISIFILAGCVSIAQHRVASTPETVRALTSEWTGERLPDGRPYVSDNLLERLKDIVMEEAWVILRNNGYETQYEGNWMMINPENPVMTGRVLTAQYMPERPDFRDKIREQGHREGHSTTGMTNSWPINLLSEGDVYVADSYGKIVGGTLIGDNLGNAIYRNSNNGVIFYGSVRDVAGLREIEGFNGWVKGQDPSYIDQVMLTSINAPIRIGRATVLPGDVVLANEFGIIFIPAHMAETVVITGEFIALRDEFGIQRIRDGVYLPGQIDSEWSDEIRQDFLRWLDEHPDKLPMSREELDEFMKDRVW